MALYAYLNAMRFLDFGYSATVDAGGISIADADDADPGDAAAAQRSDQTGATMTRRLAPWISLLLVWSLLPMLWQLISSFSTAESLVDGSIPFLQRWTLVHYKELLASDPPFWRYLLNSAIVSGLTTVITLALAIPAAYGLARVPQQLRRIVRWMTAAAALFPYVLLFLALLELARRFSLGNSLIALAMPYQVWPCLWPFCC